MPGKRRNEHAQLTREDYEALDAAPDSQPDPRGFQRASQAQMVKRQMRKAVKPKGQTSPVPPTDGAAQGTGGASPSNPFASINLKAPATGAASAPLFSFGAAASSNTAAGDTAPGFVFPTAVATAAQATTPSPLLPEQKLPAAPSANASSVAATTTTEATSGINTNWKEQSAELNAVYSGALQRLAELGCPVGRLQILVDGYLLSVFQQEDAFFAAEKARRQAAEAAAAASNAAAAAAAAAAQPTAGFSFGNFAAASSGGGGGGAGASSSGYATGTSSMLSSGSEPEPSMPAPPPRPPVVQAPPAAAGAPVADVAAAAGSADEESDEAAGATSTDGDAADAVRPAAEDPDWEDIGTYGPVLFHYKGKTDEKPIPFTRGTLRLQRPKVSGGAAGSYHRMIMYDQMNLRVNMSVPPGTKFVYSTKQNKKKTQEYAVIVFYGVNIGGRGYEQFLIKVRAETGQPLYDQLRDIAGTD